MRLTFQVTPDQRIVFTAHAVSQMIAFRQQSRWQAEAGGVLLGRHLLDSNDFVVDEVTAPQREDIRSRFSFFRSKQHNAVAQMRWRRERQTLAYLGLWHTHPEADPTPSRTDRKDWEQAVSQDTFDGDRLFFPIIGTEAIRVWSKCRRGVIEELNQLGTIDE